MENLGKQHRAIEHLMALNQVPRASKNEQRISDYLKAFGESLGLETIQDEALNVIIKKPASPGYEDHAPVILQGHMDMVCEKADACKIDFLKDPIPMVIEGDWLMAPETTLGADNGAGVAMAMTILEDDSLAHPPLEVLITSDEESGMTGAMALDFDLLQGRRLINLDTDEEGVAIAGCAGGERIFLDYEFTRSAPEGYDQALHVTVSGVTGGHSGSEIHKGLANAVLALARVLRKVQNVAQVALIDIDGGALDNAIPRLAVATIATKAEDEMAIRHVVAEMEAILQGEHRDTDPSLTVKVEPAPLRDIVAGDVLSRVVDAMLMMPVGVQAMNQGLGVVESSNNMGVVKMKDDFIILTNALRSSTFSLRELTVERMMAVARRTGAAIRRTAGYPAWPYQKGTPLQQAVSDSYRRLMGKELTIQVIHAGLECGLFAEKMPELDMISFGPTIVGCHAPGEKVSISSVERIQELLVDVLAHL